MSCCGRCDLGIRRVFPIAILVAAVVLSALVGCDRAGTPPSPPKTPLRVSGSGTCLPLLRILADEQPDESARLVFLPGLHSKGGIKGVAQGSLEMGAVSRELTPDERSEGLEVTWLANDGLVMAVNDSVAEIGITGLTDQQVRDIYAGTYRDWKELGASESLPIIVLDRHEDESAKIILRMHVLGPADQFTVTADSVNLYYESDMVDALEATSGGIGYFSLGYSLSQRIDVTHLTLNGVEATVESIESGRYTMVRPLGIVTKADAPQEVRDFVEWTRGPDARDVMLKEGYAPYSD